jgi:hypothetical protein
MEEFQAQLNTLPQPVDAIDLALIDIGELLNGNFLVKLKAAFRA